MPISPVWPKPYSAMGRMWTAVAVQTRPLRARDARSHESVGFVPRTGCRFVAGTDGMYGPGTSAIAIAIQKEIGLTVDGKVGLNTRAAETTSVT